MIVLLNALQAGNRSGTGRYSIELARWLPELARDIAVRVLWPAHVPLPTGARGFEDAFVLRGAAHPLERLYRDQVAMRSECARARADLVHYPASVGSLRASERQVITVHDLSFLHAPEWFAPGRAAYYGFAIGRSARLARRVIADSEATAGDLREKLGVPADRIDVVPLGVSERFRPAEPAASSSVRARYRLPERFFLYAGTVEPRKNLVRVIEAWSRVADACAVDLAIAGRDGWKHAPVSRAIAQAKCGARIHRIGYVEEEDFPALLSAADAFVWPSLWEGFGLPPLEAMACGTPVLTSRVSSLPEVVGDAALLVDPNDTAAIAANLLRLAEDDTLRARLRVLGLERAAGYSWRATAQHVLETYRVALGG